MFRTRTSIAFIVAVALVTATTLALGALGVINYRGAKSRELERVRFDLALDADQIAPSLDLPVWNFDRLEITKVVEGMMLDPALQAAEVRSADDQAVLCARERDLQGHIKVLEKELPAAGFLVEKRDITLAGEKLATVTLLGTTKSVDVTIHSILIWTVFNIVSIDLVLIAGLYLLLWWLVLRPLKTLEHHAAIVSTGSGESMMLQGPRFRGELENLRASLAKMFRLLEERYEALRLSREQFQRVFEHSEMGMIIVELSGYFRAGNQAFCRMLGYSGEELARLTFADVTHPQEREMCISEIRLLIDGKKNPLLLEKRYVRKDGSTVWGLLVGSVVRDQQGKALFMVGQVQDITRRRRAETERQQAVEREQQARIEYTFQLIAAQEAERKRIAAELHDSLGQNLLLIKNLAQMALREPDPAQASEKVASIDHLAAQCIAETRQISRDLHPHQLDHLGLKRALESMLESVAAASGIGFQWKIDDVDKLFTAEGAMNLYRVVQESLNNILKHSRAKTARVDFERDIHEVRLRITDDGCGFTPDRLAENKKGLGLKNIPERVRMLGGSMKMDSTPGGGTRIKVVIPVRAGPE
ncbi:MAG TPA: PAS domain S-box protein [Verrucomicrobiae bacterium]|nr:PAS domain S-box protein [Verrucomicrobiae bacterium]